MSEGEFTNGEYFDAYEAEEQAKIEARLVAAAPDLLRACQMWDEGFTNGEEFTAEQFREWVNKNRRAAREAIKKALGAE